MPPFRLQYIFTPTAPFGLPDGQKVVLPAGKQTISSPLIHFRSGAISSHGTLPRYRSDDERLSAEFGNGTPMLAMADNFGILTVDADSAQSAYELGGPLMERICQALSVQSGQRFSATLQFIEDEDDNVSVPQPPKILELGTTGTYNLDQLQARLREAFSWARDADDRVEKALLYVEHAFVLHEFARTQGLVSRQAAFSRGFAFLQLFKALAVILGEKGKDTDYQRRFLELGLPASFWKERVEPLYRVRNDEDVAHYRLASPEPRAFETDFGKALVVFRDAMTAYGRQIGGGDGRSASDV